MTAANRRTLHVLIGLLITAIAALGTIEFIQMREVAGLIVLWCFIGGISAGIVLAIKNNCM